MSNIYFLCDKPKKLILSVGPLPETWENISGLNEGMGKCISDLSWAGHLDKGFLTEEEAVSIGVTTESINSCKQGRAEMVWGEIRSYRNYLISQIRWRIERHQDEVSIGLLPTEDITPVLKYIQELRDITKQDDPINVIWPIPPA